jgi:hypothetical protein
MPIFTTWARLLLLLFSCQGSFAPFQKQRHKAAKSSPIYSSSSLESSPFLLVPKAPAHSLRLPLARTSHPLRTAANYLIGLEASRRKDAEDMIFLGVFLGHGRLIAVNRGGTSASVSALFLGDPLRQGVDDLLGLFRAGNIELRFYCILFLTFLVATDGVHVLTEVAAALVESLVAKKNSGPGPFGKDFLAGLFGYLYTVFFIVNGEIFDSCAHDVVPWWFLICIGPCTPAELYARGGHKGHTGHYLA